MAGRRKSKCTEEQIKELLLQGLPRYKVRKQLHTSYELVTAVATGLEGVYANQKRPEEAFLSLKMSQMGQVKQLMDDWERTTQALRKMGFRKARPDEQVEWITRMDVVRGLRHE